MLYYLKLIYIGWVLCLHRLWLVIKHMLVSRDVMPAHYSLCLIVYCVTGSRWVAGWVGGKLAGGKLSHQENKIIWHTVNSDFLNKMQKWVMTENIGISQCSGIDYKSGVQQGDLQHYWKDRNRKSTKNINIKKCKSKTGFHNAPLM